MNLMTLISEIGDDYDLLTRSDEWLEEERKSISTDLDRITKELYSVLMAQRAKRLLQDKNLVAVQSLVKDEEGEIKDIAIKVMNIRDAIQLLKKEIGTPLDHLNTIAQIDGWIQDGYDLENATKYKKISGDNNAEKQI